MSSEKRLVLFLVLSVSLMFGTQMLMQKLGLVTEPPKKEQVKANNDAKAPNEANPAEPKVPNEANPAEASGAPSQPVLKEAPKPKAPEIPLATAGELTLGSVDDTTPDGYRLQIMLSQGGGGVSLVQLTDFDAEYQDGKVRKQPLALINGRNAKVPAPLELTLSPKTKGGGESSTEWPLDRKMWEVVRGPDGKTVQEVTEGGAGQQITFRTTAEDITVTKKFTLRKGQNDFELDITLESPNEDKTLEYTLMGPHGIPIEGEWYASTFRDICFGQVSGRDSVTVVTKSAYDVAKYASEPEILEILPLQFAGVENQYFTTFLGHKRPLVSQETRLDSAARAILITADPTKAGKDDVGVSITSKTIEVGPNRPVTHSWVVYAGPKDIEKLRQYGAEDLATYRKNQWFSIPGGSWIAKNVIDPMLRATYGLTSSVARIFGYKRGNYGVAIILLTMAVRLIMFPLGRRSAMMAKKAQDLAPQMAEIKEKYKDDKERQGRETMALYKRVGFNPVSGCLPALIQMPIFVGLWQALNNSVSLRHASFLYIRNLAAPDMLFKFPATLPFLGDYFNVLPFIVVGLMLVQTKLFQPPAITDEQKQQQSMMKFMMIFMAFMFYKVPSGLGLYFITSSTWQICERLLLPKVTPAKRLASSEVIDVTDKARAVATGSDSNGTNSPAATGWLAKIERKLQSYVDDAQGSKTIRNAESTARIREQKNEDPSPPRDKNRPKPPGKRR